MVPCARYKTNLSVKVLSFGHYFTVLITRDLLLGESSGSSCYHQVNCTLRDGSISRVLRDANTTDDWKGWKAAGKMPRLLMRELFSQFQIDFPLRYSADLISPPRAGGWGGGIPR